MTETKKVNIQPNIMQNRKFRGDRLYKVAKIVVVLLTIYFVFNTIKLYYRLDRFQTLRDVCPYSTATSEDKYYTECRSNNLIIIHNIENSIHNNVFMAILLPALFFGGAALYRYIFPLNRKNSKLVKYEYKTRSH